MNSNRITWTRRIVAIMADKGFRPFLGYWVRPGDDRLYLLAEVLSGEFGEF